MAYIPNLSWSVADVDRVQSMAKAGYSASHIATILRRTENAVRILCDQNGIHVRHKSVGRP